MNPNAPRPLHSIAVAEIDDSDRTYAIRADCEPPPELVRSIQAVGVLSPPRIESMAGGRYRVISGFRRLKVARLAGIESVDCLVFPPGKESTRFLEAVHENLGTRRFTDLECGEILLKLLESFGRSKNELLQTFLPLLGLKAEPRVLERLLRLARMPSVLKTALENWRSDLVLRAAGWSEPEQRLLESLGRRYRIGHSRQKEVVSLFVELRAARRAAGERAELQTIWEDSGAASVDLDSRIPQPERLERIVRALRMARYPLLSAQLAKAADRKRSLKIPGGLRLDLPRHLEGSRIQFQGSFGSPDELRRLAGELTRISEQAELRELFELL